MCVSLIPNDFFPLTKNAFKSDRKLAFDCLVGRNWKKRSPERIRTLKTFQANIILKDPFH